jgi:hypothetical protein
MGRKMLDHLVADVMVGGTMKVGEFNVAKHRMHVLKRKKRKKDADDVSICASVTAQQGSIQVEETLVRCSGKRMMGDAFAFRPKVKQRPCPD